MKFEGSYQAVIACDPEIEMFRGEFVGLNGGAGFYARDTDSLKREGKTSLFLRMCAEDGCRPRRHPSPGRVPQRGGGGRCGREVSQYVHHGCRAADRCGVACLMMERVMDENKFRIKRLHCLLGKGSATKDMEDVSLADRTWASCHTGGMEAISDGISRSCCRGTTDIADDLSRHIQDTMLYKALPHEEKEKFSPAWQ